MAAPLQLTRTHRVLIGVVVAGAVIIAGIGFAGSYAAVRELALKKGFGNFSYVFPIGIDAGICVLLALDLLLTWIRIPFPLLRQTAWLLTAATIAFNGAAAWPDPLGVGMHGVIPILFVVSVEAARHAIGRIADITADKHMEGVRLTRWLLSPVPTFLLWRRMKLWELRSYEQVIKLEQERLVYQARLRSRFGRAWRRKAPVESLMPLRLAKYGVPLAETAPAGLAAAGIEPALIPPAPRQALDAAAAPGRAADGRAVGAAPVPQGAVSYGERRPDLDGTPVGEHAKAGPEPEESPWFNTPREVEYQGGYDPAYDPEQYAEWFAEQQQAEEYLEDRPHDASSSSPSLSSSPPPSPSPEDTGSFPIPVVPGRTRELGDGGGPPEPTEEDYYQVFRESTKGGNGAPTPRGFISDVEATYGVALDEADVKRMMKRFSNRLNAELTDEHIA
ncbi:DUF2637 domain-containing protein [Streptomyces cahuitamycinicus]|uniref:DUF2637 domain-containing protein n=1 Tax=Streptomyces cahuitamycinicus TaxID=2070367 RepID=A0A2N8TNU0_9ACTN|nr:DUF2637 domain-containing protein [Streptomyces cahuitamycinicus]PNG20692.1 hypothetical protein C1J00_18845 [Streptomyces cahuitamycinicus]